MDARITRRVFLSIALVSALVGAAIEEGCGTSSGGSASATPIGNIAGRPLAYANQVAFVSTSDGKPYGGPIGYAVVVLSNRADLCTITRMSEAVASLEYVKIVVGHPVDALPAPGVYPITPDVSLGWVLSDNLCGIMSSDIATSGNITLTTVDATTVAGSFEVTLRSGDVLKGDFAAPVCDTADASEIGVPCVP